MLLHSTGLFLFCDTPVFGVMGLVTLALGSSEGPVMTSTSYGAVIMSVCLVH